MGTLLNELEIALHHRSVSMAEDEAICIGIVAVEATARARMGAKINTTG